MKEKLLQIIDKWGCHHQWKRLEMIEVESDYGGFYRVFHYVCEKCGKFKKIKSH
jgi:hypothetical protein